MKKEDLKLRFNTYLATNSIEADIQDCVPKICQALPKIDLKKLPKLKLVFEFAN